MELVTSSDDKEFKTCKEHMAYNERLGDLEERVKSIDGKIWAIILLLVANLAGVIVGLMK